MYKLVCLVSLLLGVSAVSGGIIGAPLTHGPALALSPYHAPIASSYSNTIRVVHGSVPIVRPVAVHGPAIAVAHAPIVTPIALAHGPAIAIGHGYH